jgi:hypothetical protein
MARKSGRLPQRRRPRKAPLAALGGRWWPCCSSSTETGPPPPRANRQREPCYANSVIWAEAQITSPPDLCGCLFDVRGLFGGRTRARTWDPLIKSKLLYQISGAPVFFCSAPHRVEGVA